MSAKPYYTSSDLIAAVKRKIFLPISQATLTELDVLSFLNEEMFISQVPSVLQFHQEYFVFPVVVPLRPNVLRYPVPNRAIGMRLRDIFWQDQNGNLFELTRIQSEDKAFYQRNDGANQAIHKYYMESNDIVLTPPNLSSPTGSLVFYIFIRPNQLVYNNRAATVTAFSKTLTVDNSNINVGDALTISIFGDSGAATRYVLTATSGTPSANQFLIGADSIATATNLSLAILGLGILENSSNGTPSTNTVTITYDELNTTFTTVNANNQTTLGIIVESQQGIVFDNVPTTWLNPVTNISEPLFANGLLVDFLQTNPGHKIKAYDKLIPSNGISSNTINFAQQDVPIDFEIGDYICLQNECIIPFLPPDLHNGLAERACARILAALGDQTGLAMSNAKIQEIDSKQGNLLDNRVDGDPLKVTARKSLLRFGKVSTIRRF